VLWRGALRGPAKASCERSGGRHEDATDGVADRLEVIRGPLKEAEVNSVVLEKGLEIRNKSSGRVADSYFVTVPNMLLAGLQLLVLAFEAALDADRTVSKTLL